MFCSNGLSLIQTRLNFHTKQTHNLYKLKRRRQHPQQTKVISTNEEQQVLRINQNHQQHQDQPQIQQQQQNQIQKNESNIQQQFALPLVFDQALKNLGRTEMTSAEERMYISLEKNWYVTIDTLMNLSYEEAILLDIPLRLAIELREIAAQLYQVQLQQKIVQSNQPRQIPQNQQPQNREFSLNQEVQSGSDLSLIQYRQQQQLRQNDQNFQNLQQFRNNFKSENFGRFFEQGEAGEREEEEDQDEEGQNVEQYKEQFVQDDLLIKDGEESQEYVMDNKQLWGDILSVDDKQDNEEQKYSEEDADIVSLDDDLDSGEEEEEEEYGEEVEQEEEKEERENKKTMDSFPVFPGTKALEIIGKEVILQNGPFPDNYLELQQNREVYVRTRKHYSKPLKGVTFERLPEELQEQCNLVLDKIPEENLRKYQRTKVVLAQCLHYFHIEEKKPWDKIKLENLKPRDGKQFYVLYSKIIDWLVNNTKFSFAQEKYFLASLALLIDYFYPTVVKQNYNVKFRDKFEILRENAVKRKNKATSNITFQTIMDSIIHRRNMVRGKYRKDKQIAQDLSQYLQIVFSIAFYEENAFGLKFDDVEKRGENYWVHIEKQWYEIPEYFTKELDLYVDKYRDILEPQCNDFFVRRTGKAIEADYVYRAVQRTLTKIGGVFVARLQIRKIVFAYIRDKLA